jgi:hypothetical protein
LSLYLQVDHWNLFIISRDECALNMGKRGPQIEAEIHQIKLPSEKERVILAHENDELFDHSAQCLWSFLSDDRSGWQVAGKTARKVERLSWKLSRFIEISLNSFVKSMFDY